MANNTTFYCDLGEFSKTYRHIHGPLSVLVCVFGSVANVLNICVLTSKEMRWPTNLILTGLAVADLLVMLEYIPFAFQRYIMDTKYVYMYTYNDAVFMVFHALFSQICHFISCCLTVILAVWRLVAITSPHSTRGWCNMKNTLYAIIATYVTCPLICYPVYLSTTIAEHNQTCDSNGHILDRNELRNFTGETFNKTIFYATHNPSYRKVSFWIYGVIIKLIPCIFLTILSSGLIYVLFRTKKRRKVLLNSSLPLKNANSSSTKPILGKKVDQDRQADRTSTMLLAVLLLFLITEFPQAILGLLSVSIGTEFESQCYTPLGDVMDIVALTNSAINFILYCTMSRQFRTTFKNVFWPKICQGWYTLTRHASNEKTNNCEKTQLSQV